MMAGFWFFQIIDAINGAKAINQAALGQKPAAREQIFPDAGPSGSIFWGIVLIVLGALLTLANFEVILYETLFDFWPVVIIIIGIKFVADHFAKMKNGN